MATLENIRKRSGLLLITIGLAMAAFILMDLLGSGDSLIRGNQLMVGKINGRSIDLPEFSERMDQITENYRQTSGDMSLANVTRKQFAEAAWEEFIREYTLTKDLEVLGLSVGDDELYSRIIQHPDILQADAFRDEVTNAFSEARLQQYLTSLQDQRFDNPEANRFWQQWKAFENNMRSEALNNKYNIAISLGIHKPEKLAKFNFELENRVRNVELIPILYSTIPDGDVTVTESDLKSYYKKNKNDFKVDEPYRNFEFVVLDVKPSANDIQQVQDELNKFTRPQLERNRATDTYDTIPPFAEADNDSLFVALRSDLPYRGKFYREALGFNPDYDSIIFAGDATGFVFGPYETNEGDYLALGKVSEVAYLPDSVQARHILIAYQGAERSQAQRAPFEAKELADSLLNILRTDRSQFETLSSDNSDDASAAQQGGDLGWFVENTMTPAFSDFCFTNRTGDIGLIETEFGFHIIEITGQKGSSKAVRIAEIAREIITSEKTDTDVYRKASKIAEAAADADKFAELAREAGAQVRTATDVNRFDETVIGLGANRDLVRWVFDEERRVGHVDVQRSASNSYIVIHVTDIVEDDFAPFESVRETIEDIVFNNKKAAIIRERLQTHLNKEMDVIAQEMNTTVTNTDVPFSSNSIERAGEEPKVVGKIHGIQEQAITVIEGDRGVYVVKVNSTTTAPEQPDYIAEQETYLNSIRGRIPAGVVESKRDAAKIVDRRYKFF
ncbi:MAG: SurA N-terminal domain-containing protein [Cryomorphaceae bacterium]|nr:SurA N-terminal domain-containing protein [Cryomorphaceae bacterium]